MRTDACRSTIVTSFAGWTALSALRSGSPIKSRARIYPLLDSVKFCDVLGPEDSPIERREFDAWHHDETKRMTSTDADLVIGWSAKLINVYLKTAAYVGDLGRPGLRELLHPPIDGGLWDGLARRFADDSASLSAVTTVRTSRISRAMRPTPQ